VNRRVLVIGLDCATPQFVFDSHSFDMPNLRALMQVGQWGRLRSCHPPITVPAWACMTSGKDPGQLGIYGFRNRHDYSYGEMRAADSTSVAEPRLWDIISGHGKKVCVLGVPQTYPPKPVNGCMVSGFLTPGADAVYTYPPDLKGELLENAGEYQIDVENFRTHDGESLYGRLEALSKNQFGYAMYLIREKPWDFFMMTDMSLDRLHHAFWRYCDPMHHAFQHDTPFRCAFQNFYKKLDARIGALLSAVGEDVTVMVVSDHGARRMMGGFCVNQWLMREGLLHLRTPVDTITRIEDCDIDWEKTKVWGAGGYYARIFLNVAGREPRGVIPPEQYESYRDILIERIESMAAHNGILMKNQALKPQEIYRETKNIPPDLIVYWDNLNYRSLGSLGHEDIFSPVNDIGADDSNHDFDGIFITDRPGKSSGEELHSLNILDIAPTVLHEMGLPIPEDLPGRPISTR